MLCLLCACRPAGEGADVLLFEFLGDKEIPAGQMYSTDPHEGEALTPTLIAALYARGDGFCEYGDAVEEGAVYLSARPEERFEAGVFLCYGSADTKAVSEMCLRRAAFLERFGEVEVTVEYRGRAVYYMVE